ncbi:MAG: hypothetical protein K8T90_05050 [Planctomycetes bacterium]|nr:hypothetical protein [Planctomycetota bacterium]
MRSGVRLAILVAAGSLLVAGAVFVAAMSGPPERVWAFVPSPPWSEDPPPHAAETEGGAPLPSASWTAVIATSGGGASPVFVVREPSRFFRRLMAAFGRTANGDRYSAIDAGHPVAGGRWHECVLVDADAPDRAATVGVR